MSSRNFSRGAATDRSPQRELWDDSLRHAKAPEERQNFIQSAEPTASTTISRSGSIRSRLEYARIEQPERLPSISRGLRSAQRDDTPGAISPTNRIAQRCHQSNTGMDGDGTPSGCALKRGRLSRGCRCAQPPANRCQPSGLETPVQQQPPSKKPVQRRTLLGPFVASSLHSGSSSLVGRSARPSRSAGCQPAVVMNFSRPGRAGYLTGQRPVLLATLTP